MSYMPWTERELHRASKRVALFMRRGLTEDRATDVADRLVQRDRDLDDRHLCIECENWQQSRTCFKNLPTSPEQLVRCPGFTWQQP